MAKQIDTEQNLEYYKTNPNLEHNENQWSTSRIKHTHIPQKWIHQAK